MPNVSCAWSRTRGLGCLRRSSNNPVSAATRSGGIPAERQVCAACSGVMSTYLIGRPAAADRHSAILVPVSACGPVMA